MPFETAAAGSASFCEHCAGARTRAIVLSTPQGGGESRSIFTYERQLRNCTEKKTWRGGTRPDVGSGRACEDLVDESYDGRSNQNQLDQQSRFSPTQTPA